MFIVDAKVLYQLCCFGIGDTDEVLTDLCLLMSLFARSGADLISWLCLTVHWTIWLTNYWAARLTDKRLTSTTPDKPDILLLRMCRFMTSQRRHCYTYYRVSCWCRPPDGSSL